MTEEAVQGNTESVSGVEATQGTETVQDDTTQAAAEAINEAAIQPPAYTDFTLPEGMEMDKGAIDAFIPIAQQLGLSQEDAQQIVNIGVQMAESTTRQVKQQREQAIEKANEQWMKAIESDPEIGGEKLEENLTVANNFLNKYATPGFKKLLVDTNLGNNPDVIKTIWKIAQQYADDDLVIGGTAGRPGGAKLMYDQSPKLS